ncbi:hypothetical protein [Actinomycetia phage DSL-LC01]|nr:hypothetical protein [Actinomycetia phage DSL-LC01]
MGMDVYGVQPKTEAGEYFRNNVWWWRPLWDYCLEVAPDLAGKVEHGHSNDGDGLDAEDAVALSKRLLDLIESGETEEYELRYREQQASLPRNKCDLCGGTGVRRDAVGVQYGMPDKELDQALAVLVRRTHGWCNGCGGEGQVDHIALSYPFSVENVREFAEFLAESGGFKIC